LTTPGLPQRRTMRDHIASLIPSHWLAPDAREATCSRKCVHVLTPAERYLEFGCAADGTSGAAWREGRLRRSPIYGSSRTSLQLSIFMWCAVRHAQGGVENLNSGSRVFGYCRLCVTAFGRRKPALAGAMWLASGGSELVAAGCGHGAVDGTQLLRAIEWDAARIAAWQERGVGTWLRHCSTASELRGCRRHGHLPPGLNYSTGLFLGFDSGDFSFSVMQ
jgi:hypothetical protein